MDALSEGAEGAVKAVTVEAMISTGLVVMIVIDYINKGD